jgi:hypothetical protein
MLGSPLILFAGFSSFLYLAVRSRDAALSEEREVSRGAQQQPA